MEVEPETNWMMDECRQYVLSLWYDRNLHFSVIVPVFRLCQPCEQNRIHDLQCYRSNQKSWLSAQQ